MKTKLTILLVFLCSILYSQKLPEMVIDPNILKNNLDIRTYTVTDTSDLCYQEGHYVLGRNRYIRYSTLLYNVGDTVAYYGRPCCDPGWSRDICHGHDHYEPGIQVTLYRWMDNVWNAISHNQKLDYAMANDSKFPAYWNSQFLGFDSLGNPMRSHTFVIDSRLDREWFEQYAEIDSELAKWQCCPVSGGGYDAFYYYPEVDYNSINRGIMPYFGDLYSNGTLGNWNVIPDSVDGFYKLEAWHKPLFEQKNTFPDTASTIFYIKGNTIIKDTIPQIPSCNSDTIPVSILAVKLNGQFGTREVILNGINATETCPFQVERLIAIGKNENRWNVSAVLTINKSEFMDYSAPTGLPICYRASGILSNKVKYK